MKIIKVILIALFISSGSLRVQAQQIEGYTVTYEYETRLTSYYPTRANAATAASTRNFFIIVWFLMVYY